MNLALVRSLSRGRVCGPERRRLPPSRDGVSITLETVAELQCANICFVGSENRRVRPIVGLILLLARCACAAALDRTGASQVGTAPTFPSQAPQAKLSFTHLSVADGLSHADVRAIVQDHQGFMWFGTWPGGLNRHDGYSFKVYKHDDRDDRSIGRDSIVEYGPMAVRVAGQYSTLLCR